MADSVAFDHLCGELEARSSLDRLEARGTIRIALKSAGLDPRSVSPDQLGVVVDKLLSAELANRGIEGSEALCDQLRRGLEGLDVGNSCDTPEAVFSRLGGGT
jgi:hypothetical protein